MDGTETLIRQAFRSFSTGRLAVVTAVTLLTLGTATGCNLKKVANEAAEQTKQFINPWNLQPGACYDDKNINSGQVASITAIPCTTPHNSQIVDVVTYPAGTKWGDLSKKAQEDCTKAFENKLLPEVFEVYGKNDGTYEGAYLYPQSTDWKDTVGNKVACVLQSKQPMTTSAVS